MRSVYWNHHLADKFAALENSETIAACNVRLQQTAWGRQIVTYPTQSRI